MQKPKHIVAYITVEPKVCFLFILRQDSLAKRKGCQVPNKICNAFLLGADGKGLHAHYLCKQEVHITGYICAGITLINSRLDFNYQNTNQNVRNTNMRGEAGRED